MIKKITYLPGLDLLRILAILFVFLWHYPRPVLFAPYGWAGVDLFFALSGFLIGGQILEELATSGRVDFFRFYIRRSFRILPCFLVTLLFYVVTQKIKGGHLVASVWRYLTFTMNFGLTLGDGRAFSHAWSLCVEEHFYLMVPAILWLGSRFLRPRGTISLVLILIALGMMTRAGIWHHVLNLPGIFTHRGLLNRLYYRDIYFPSYGRLDGLCLGVFLASIRVLRPLLWQKLLRFGNWALLGGALLVFVALRISTNKYSMPSATWVFPLLALGFSLWLIAACSPHVWLSKCRFPGIRKGASYVFCFYLVHKGVLTWVCSQVPGPSAFLLSWLGSFAAAVAMHHLIERPFLQWRDFFFDPNSHTNNALHPGLAR